MFSTVASALCMVAFIQSVNGLQRIQTVKTIKYSTISSHRSLAKLSRPSAWVKDRSSALLALRRDPNPADSTPINKWITEIKKGLLIGIMAFGFFGADSSAYAADTVAVGKCLLTSCQKQLAKCLLNGPCLANIVCLNTCNGKSDEAACQIRCGDLFENEVVSEFNACAVSNKRCVPRKMDKDIYPMPATEALVPQFDTSIWSGRWYISAGLNKIFDTFDCQVHFFTSPSPGTFYAKLFWRVTEPDGEFFTKKALQRFVQDPKQPAHLLNHDNEYLHYQDDWYVLDYEPDDFVLVYYRGSNDAWDGYGGAVVYTRSPSLRPELLPRLEAAWQRAKLPYTWKDFTLTNNECPAESDEDKQQMRAEFVKKLLQSEEEALQTQLTVARSSVVNSVLQESQEVQKAAQKLEQEVEMFLKESSNTATGKTSARK